MNEAEMLRNILDQLAFGVIVVDSGLAIQYTNSQAQVLLESAWPGYSRTCRDLGCSSVFSSKVGALVARGEGAITLPPREPGQMPLELLVSRFSGIPASEELALIFLVDPAHIPASFPERLQELYEVTPAEARVAVALGQGARIADGAQALGVGAETIRSHQKALCRKLGAKHRAHLVWRLNACVASLIAASDPLSMIEDIL